MAPIAELRTEIERGRSALRQAIEAAAPGWEQERAPHPGEEEAWTPRATAEHAVGAEIGFAATVAEAIGVPPPPREVYLFDTPDEALAAVPAAAAAADAVFAAVAEEQLSIETGFGDHVQGVLKIAAWHLRAHARQVMGLEAEG